MSSSLQKLRIQCTKDLQQYTFQNFSIITNSDEDSSAVSPARSLDNGIVIASVSITRQRLLSSDWDKHKDRWLELQEEVLVTAASEPLLQLEAEAVSQCLHVLAAAF